MRLDLVYSSAGVSTVMFLTAPQGMFVVECGDGAVRDLIEVGRSMIDADIPVEPDLSLTAEAISAVVISHAHYDHYSGLLTLLGFLNLLGRKSPLTVVYPEGGTAVEGIVDHFVDNLSEDVSFDIDLISCGDGSILNFDDVEIRCRAALHRDSKPGQVGEIIPALSYKIIYEDESIVFSGDTGDGETLAEFVNGCDLAVVEATYAEGNEISDGVHLTVDQALRASAGASERILVHFTGRSREVYRSRMK